MGVNFNFWRVPVEYYLYVARYSDGLVVRKLIKVETLDRSDKKPEDFFLTLGDKQVKLEGRVLMEAESHIEHLLSNVYTGSVVRDIA